MEMIELAAAILAVEEKFPGEYETVRVSYARRPNGNKQRPHCQCCGRRFSRPASNVGIAFAQGRKIVRNLCPACTNAMIAVMDQRKGGGK